jgi:MerR family transcriptional regulator, copper efflux regulator
VQSLTIKKTADLAGVGIETVRFYERENLIPPPPRTQSGYRQYPPQVVDRIRFIKRAQSLGFSLPEIRDLLSLTVEAGTTPADIRATAERKILDIEQKIETLQRMRSTLIRVTRACQGHGALSDCPILEALTSDE